MPDSPAPHVVRQSATYEGDLRCRAWHEPSAATVVTDAPTDNQGKGESFSPTDLLCTALSTCALTTMAIVARRDGYDIDDAEVRVEKSMTASPRRVGRIGLKYVLPAHVTPERLESLKRAAAACPVHRSLHPDVAVDAEYEVRAL